jgi:tetratricopeptide (TPR) repeat protein
MSGRASRRKGLRDALAVCLLGALFGSTNLLRAAPGTGRETGAGLPGIAASPAPQEVSSFYLRLYESGRKAFREKRYRDAAGDLEIAVFGLANDKILYGKAQIYLAICFNYLAMRPKVEPALAQAARLLGPEDVKAIGFDEEVLALLRKLVEDFRIDLEIPPPPGSVPVAEPAPDPPPVTSDPPEKTGPPVVEKTAVPPPAATKPPVKSKPPAADLVFVHKVEEKKPPAEPPPLPNSPGKNSLPDVKPLEKRLKSESDNPVLVEEIVSLYFRRGEPKKAKTVLEKYLGSRPADLAAAFSLAKANYFLKEYKTAMDGLQALSTPAVEATLDRETTLRIAIYKALCLFAMGQESSVAAYLNFVTANVGPEDLARILEGEGLNDPWAVMLARLKR